MASAFILRINDRMNTIEILGIKGHEKTKQLRENVVQALQVIGLDIEVKEVHQVDVRLAAEIDAIPALKINGKIVLQQTIPAVEQLNVLLKMWLAPSHSSLQLKKLLVPTDFSASAQNAYRFALDMVQESDAHIQLVHYYQAELDPVYPYFGVASFSFVQKLKEKLETTSKNERLVAGLVEDASLVVNTSLLEGFVETELPQLALNFAIDMIIMGTTGEGGFLNKWLGTVSSIVAQKATCPTLLVPNGVKFKGFKHILFASDFQADDEVILQQVLDFAAVYDANVHFVHVAEPSKRGHYSHQMPIEALLREKAPLSIFTMTTIKNSKPLEAINRYSKENNIDLVALATTQRNFMANMLYKSMTRQLIFNSEIPLMVLHFDL